MRGARSLWASHVRGAGEGRRRVHHLGTRRAPAPLASPARRPGPPVRSRWVGSAGGRARGCKGGGLPPSAERRPTGGVAGGAGDRRRRPCAGPVRRDGQTRGEGPAPRALPAAPGERSSVRPGSVCPAREGGGEGDSGV